MKREKAVEIDEALEACVVAVESAVVDYLVRITPSSTEALRTTLASLDAETAASDDFRSRQGAVATLAGVAGLGTSSLDVIGQTRKFPIVNRVPAPVFRAQVALVRAAKAELLDGTPQTLAALTAANDGLAAARSRHVR